MMNKYYLLLFIISLIYMGCREEKHFFENVNIIETEINLDSLFTNNCYITNDTLMFSREAHYAVSESHIYVYDDYELFVFDKDLNRVKFIDLKHQDYYLSQSIVKMKYYGNKLYFLDSSFEIKIFDLVNHSFDKINFNKAFLNFPSNSSDIAISKNCIYISSYILMSLKYTDAENIILGVKLDNKGNKLAEYFLDRKTFMKNRIDHYANSYMQTTREKVFFTFNISDKIIVFKQNGEFENIYKVKPEKSMEEILTNSEIPETFDSGKMVTHRSYFNNKIQVGTQIYYLEFQGTKTPMKLVKYDKQFNKLKSFTLSNIPATSHYKLCARKNFSVLIEDQIYVYR